MQENPYKAPLETGSRIALRRRNIFLFALLATVAILSGLFAVLGAIVAVAQSFGFAPVDDNDRIDTPTSIMGMIISSVICAGSVMLIRRAGKRAA